MSILRYGLIFVVVFVCDVFQTTCSNQDFRDGLTMKMIYQDSPNSPIYCPNQTEAERIQKLIHTSKLRYESIVAATNNQSLMVANPGGVQSLINTQEYTYMVQLGIGQFSGTVIPYLPYYLVMDIGSETTWLQCEWCKRCFRQRDPYFPWSRSLTYNPFACPACPPTSSRCPRDACTFSLSYFDGSSAKGNWARETFSFQLSGSIKTFPDIIFGCGVEMHSPTLERIPNNVISGALGMGYGSKSFATQLKNRGLGTFSYCLHKLSIPSHSNAPMFLRFADHIPQVHGMVSTPLRMVANKLNYYVNLLHLSVGSTRLNIPNGMFAVKADNSGGVIIDSGAAISHIVSGAYQILLNSIATYIESNNRNLKRIAGADSFFDACWVGPSDPSQVNLPSVTFHFQNADMIMQSSSVFYQNKTQSPARYCLAIRRGTPSRSVSVIGAYQQGNQRIIYDLNRNQLIFKAVDCSQQNN